ncbi:MAG: hypothetical protein J6S63_11900 [Atopobiaceae bacterium]|nr:hypothetical protein [Atopobiaceae bacterium]
MTPADGSDLTDQLLDALCAVGEREEMRLLLRDLLTAKELQDLAQRLAVAKLLNEGLSYVMVSRLTGASSTTVSRVSKCLNGTNGGYRLVFDKLDH